MILIGRYSSPFVRRVGVSLHLLDIPYDLNPISTITDRAAVQVYNPLGRVPALLLDGEEVLIDSSPILDYLDELVGPERALVPPIGADRRHVLKLIAIALGVMEKSLSCYVERKLRPSDKLFQDWLDRCSNQALAGLTALEAITPEDGWLHDGKITQADITTVCALDFLKLTWADLLANGQFPRLTALAERANMLPPFAVTQAG